jgi:hypothetical protein
MQASELRGDPGSVRPAEEHSSGQEDLGGLGGACQSLHRAMLLAVRREPAQCQQRLLER